MALGMYPYKCTIVFSLSQDANKICSPLFEVSLAFHHSSAFEFLEVLFYRVFNPGYLDVCDM